MFVSQPTTNWQGRRWSADCPESSAYVTQHLRTVLISIEDPIFRLDVESAFSGAGYRVVPPDQTVVPGEGISLALIDVDPPRTDSGTLIETLRTAGIPVVVVTSDAPRDELDRDLDYVRVAKPLASDRLVEQVSSLLSTGAAKACAP